MYKKLLLLLIIIFNNPFAHALNECRITESGTVTFELSRCRLLPNQIEEIDSYLTSHSLLHALSLWEVDMDQVTTLSLLDVVSKHQNINELDLYQADFNEQAFAKLAQNPNINVLALVGEHIDANAFLQLTKNHSLQILLIHEALVSASTIGKFLDSHPLKYLALTRITDEDIVELCKHPAFDGLSLSFLQGKNITPLKELQQLKSLRLTEVLIDEKNAESIGALSKLETLLLVNTGLTGQQTIHFAKLKNLRELQVSNYWHSDLHSQIGDKGVAFIAKLQRLEKLTLLDQAISDDGAIAISQSPNLKAVYLAANHIGDKGAIALANHDLIEALSLDSNNIEDAGGMALAQQKNIKMLGLTTNHLTDLSAYAFAESTTLNELYVNHNYFSRDGVQALKNNKYIKHLSVDDESNVK